MRKKTILDARIDVKIDCIYKMNHYGCVYNPSFQKVGMLFKTWVKRNSNKKQLKLTLF